MVELPNLPPDARVAAVPGSSVFAERARADVARLFRSPAYRFQMGLRRSTAAWFELAASQADTLRQRGHELRTYPEQCVVWLPEAAELWAPTCALFSDLPATFTALPASRAACETLASLWEPDFLLLQRAPDGECRLVGGCVCFPSAWRVTEKLGLDVTAIHEVVPTLNADLGQRIRRFFEQLAPGVVYERENWGLAAHAELNAHPDRGRPRLGADATLERVWLRVEHQALVALPTGNGILFALHLTVHPMNEVLATPGAAQDFARQLASMPEAIAEYKGLAQARGSLLRQLGLH